MQRTAGNPLVVYVLGNVPLPVPPASISDWQPLDPDRAMPADTGAGLESAGDAADLTGETRATIKLRRARLVSCPYKNLLYGHDTNLPEGLASATYQRKGPGRGVQRMVYDPRRLHDPQAWLEARLGTLVHFETNQAAFADLSDATAAGLSEGPTLAGYSIPAASVVSSTSPPAAVAVPVVDLAAPLAFPSQYAREADGLADYAGGVMPDNVRDRWRTSGLRQDQAAERVGISRPQFANALQGRFGLSADAAARLRAVVASLPVEQAALLCKTIIGNQNWRRPVRKSSNE